MKWTSVPHPFKYGLCFQRASAMAWWVKNLPAVQETWVWSLDQEDPLEKEMATYSRVFLPGESHGQRSLEGYIPWGRRSQESDTT